jgi:hypothetical protein
MERVIFLIEDSKERISCMLNPSEGERDGSGGLVIERISGVAREKLAFAGSGSGSLAVDNPVTFHGLGETRLVLNLLFDVTLPGSSTRTSDVRDLTRPLWKLTENSVGPGGERRLRRARFIWGKAWNIPIVVESLSERYERFLPDGTPQRSWMKLALLRVGEEVRPAALPPVRLTSLPSTEDLANAKTDPTWSTHQKTGDGPRGESLWHMAYRYYGNPGLWRLIARANDLINPLRLKAGALLRIPPPGIMRLGKKK